MTVAAKATFAATPATGTTYWRMGMKSKDTFSIALYTTAARTTLTEEETYDITGEALTESHANWGKYMFIAMDDSNIANSTINGSIHDIIVYAESTGNVVSADTGSDTDLTDMSHVQGQV